MNKVEQDHSLDSDRRSFLAKAGQSVGVFALLALMLPAIRFLGFKVPVKPQIIHVKKPLKPGGFIIEAEFVIFDNESGPTAVSRKCTHLGCKLNYHELEAKLVCPCHKSMFDKYGKRLDGPAKLDLPVFQVSKTGEENSTGYIVKIL